jgi:hypothetical protein
MASPVSGRDIVPNVPDRFGDVGVRSGWGECGARNRESKPGYCSFPRREETIRDAEDSVPPSGLDRLDRGKKELTPFISVLLS